MSRSAVFVVQLSRPSSQTVSVNYATVAGTATAGTDFTSVSGTISFAPGQTSAQVSVPIQDPRASGQLAENFTLVLSSPVNATITNNTGKGTVPAQNPTTYPVVSVADSSGLTSIPFTVTLSQAHTVVCRVSYSCKSITAIANQDYTPVSGTLTFNVGETSKTVNVPILAKTDQDIALKLVLASPEKVTLYRIKTGIGKITYDPTVVSLAAAVRTAFTNYEQAVADLKDANSLVDKKWAEWDTASNEYMIAVGGRETAQATVNAAVADVANNQQNVNTVGVMVGLGYAPAVLLAAAQQNLANAQTRLQDANTALDAANVKELEKYNNKNTVYAAYQAATTSRDAKATDATSKLTTYNNALATAKAAYRGSTTFQG